MTSVTTITEDEWIEAYRPMPNPVRNDAGFDFGDGCTLVETYGADIDYLAKIPENRIWTVGTDDEGRLCISSGKHFVNRLGYIVTSIPWSADIFVVDEDDEGED